MKKTSFSINKQFEFNPEIEKTHYSKSAKVDYVLLAKYSSVGYYLVVPMLLCLGVGIFIDKIFDSSPVGTLSLIIFGFVASIFNMHKLIEESKK